MGVFLGRRLTGLRNLKRISQRDLGKAVGISQVSIYKWENAKAEPRASSIRKLAEYFGVSEDYFVAKERRTVFHFSESKRVLLIKLSAGKLLLHGESSIPEGDGDFVLKTHLLSIRNCQCDMKKTDTPIPGKLHLVKKKRDDKYIIAECLLSKDGFFYRPDKDSQCLEQDEDLYLLKEDEVELDSVVLRIVDCSPVDIREWEETERSS